MVSEDVARKSRLVGGVAIGSRSSVVAMNGSNGEETKLAQETNGRPCHPERRAEFAMRRGLGEGELDWE